MILDATGQPATSELVGNEPPPKLEVRVGTLVGVATGDANGMPVVAATFRCLVAFFEFGGKRALIASPHGKRPVEVTVLMPGPEYEALAGAMKEPSDDEAPPHA